MKHSKRLLIYKILIAIFIVSAFVWPKILTEDAEIDNRALAIAIGVDVNNDDDRGSVLASAQLLIPVPQGQQIGKQEVYYGTGNTLAEALAYINVKIGRILDFGQVALIVFGEERAKSGILDDLKYLINNKVRAETSLFVAHDSEAREMLEKANSLSEEPTSSLSNLLKFNAQCTYMPNVNMLEFISSSTITDGSSFIPILNIDSKNSKTSRDGSVIEKEVKAVSSEETAEDGGEKLNEIKDVDRVFLFRKGKVCGQLDSDETKGLVWHNKDAHFGLITAENIKVGDSTIKQLPCKLRSKNVRSKVDFENGKPIITYKFKLRFTSEDLHEVNEKIDNVKPFSKSQVNISIKNALEKTIVRDVELCMQKLKTANVDALGVMKQFYKFRHKEYKKFLNENENFLENVEIRYQFNIKLY